MTMLANFALVAGLLGGALTNPIETSIQHPLIPPGDRFREVPGDSIVKLCPESRPSDLLQIDRIINRPKEFYLDDMQDVYIWGNFTRDIPVTSTLDLQINATANTGDKGWINGTYHICDWLEEMRQPPDSEEPKSCPPSKGPVLIDYAAWFADFLVAPGIWSARFDVKTPEGDRVYCLMTEFDLQCSPERDGPECLRDTTMESIGMDTLLQRAHDYLKRSRRQVLPPPI